MPPPTPADAMPTFTLPKASMLPLRTTSGTSAPVPSGFAPSLTKKPSRRSAAMCAGVRSWGGLLNSSRAPRVSYPKAKWAVAPTVPVSVRPTTGNTGSGKNWL